MYKVVPERYIRHLPFVKVSVRRLALLKPGPKNLNRARSGQCLELIKRLDLGVLILERLHFEQKAQDVGK